MPLRQTIDRAGFTGSLGSSDCMNLIHFRQMADVIIAIGLIGSIFVRKKADQQPRS